ncbi:MAG: Nif11-like leader peptide family natural product precursor [Cyanobacteriota bacterium]
MDSQRETDRFMLRLSEDEQLKQELASLSTFEEAAELASIHGYHINARELADDYASSPGWESLVTRRSPLANESYYTPTSWEYSTDSYGNRIWKDARLNILQENLRTTYNLVDAVRVQAQIDLAEVQNNLNTLSTKNPTVETIGWLASKAVESAALIFPAGTVTAVAAGLVARLLSGAIQKFTKDNRSDGYNEIQRAINDTKYAMLALFDNLQVVLTRANKEMQERWHEEFSPLGADSSSVLRPVTLSEIATYPDYFPKRGDDTQFDQVRNIVASQVKVLVTRHLLPVRFRIYELTGGPDATRFFWDVQWYGTSSTSKWEEWRRRKEFPAIPGDLRDSVEGPYEDIGGHSDIKGGNQYYQSFTNGMADERYVSYYWTRMPGHRWMYWGGNHCSSWDASRQGDSCDNRIENGNVIQGTPFLDFFDSLVVDYRDGGFYASAHKSSLVWYKLSDGSINNRAVSRMTTVDYCDDWRYQKNIFKWNWAYRGIRIRIYALVDVDGHYASDTLSDWLFRDDGAGRILNPNGVASRVDVYHNWGLATH